MNIEVTNRLTGEIISKQAETPDQVLLAIDEVEAMMDALRLLRSNLNKRATELWRERQQ